MACAPEAAVVTRQLRPRHRSRALPGFVWHGMIQQQAIVLLQCGMGATRATQAAQWLVQHYRLHGLLNVGFAGGLHACVPAGAAVIATQVGRLDDAQARMPADTEGILSTDARLVQVAATAARHARVPCQCGLLLSTARVLSQHADKDQLGHTSGALALDMEAYSIGQVATQWHLPFIILRTIFDTVLDDLPLPVTTWMAHDGTLQPWALLASIRQHPALLLRFPHLWARSRHAGQNLQRWLQHFFAVLAGEQSS